MIAKHIDKTNDFNTGNSGTAGTLVMDVSGWDYVIIHLINLAATVNFFGSNDGGAVQGETEGTPTSATNFVAIQGTNLGTGVAGTSGATNTIYKFSSVARYLQLVGTASPTCKILVYFAKISQTM